MHPALLAVNREARAETLKSYAIIFTPHGFPPASNNERDTIRQTHAGSGHGISPVHFQEPPFATLRDTDPSKLMIRSAVLRALRHHATVQYLYSWAEFDKVIILLSPTSNPKLPDSQTGEPCSQESLLSRKRGGIDAQVQESFLKVLGRQRCQSAFESGDVTGKSGHLGIPIVKVSQWMVAKDKTDSFCVHLTPLRLRK